MRHFLGDAFFKERRKLTAEGSHFRMVEWAGFEPAEYRSQSPAPYHLATILYTGLRNS